MASQIESLESELADLASSEFDRQIKLLTSIKEIGITLATALIVATGGFSYFDNANFPFYRNMPDIPAIRNIRAHQRWDKP